MKNPDTGKRVSRLNPASEWITADVPHLRLIPDDLWSAAKERQKHTRHAIATTGKLAAANRPRYLFSGLTKCGDRLCCFGARDQGTCSNKLTIRRTKSKRVSSRRCKRSFCAKTCSKIEAIKNGFAGPDLKAEWEVLQARKTALAKLESVDEPPPLLHPGMAELYGRR